MSEKKYPQSVKFFAADDVRLDSSMKPMILGLFVDDVIRPLIPVGHPAPSREAPVTLPSVAILSAFIDCEGDFSAEVALYQPNGTAVIEPQPLEGGLSTAKLQAPQGEKKNLHFVANFTPFSIPEYGKYRFVIKLDHHEYIYEFQIIGRTAQ